MMRLLRCLIAFIAAIGLAGGLTVVIIVAWVSGVWTVSGLAVVIIAGAAFLYMTETIQ